MIELGGSRWGRGGGVVLDRKKERQESPLICYCLRIPENAGMSHDDVTGLPFASKIKPYNNPNTTSTTTDATTTLLQLLYTTTDTAVPTKTTLRQVLYTTTDTTVPTNTTTTRLRRRVPTCGIIRGWPNVREELAQTTHIAIRKFFFLLSLLFFFF